MKTLLFLAAASAQDGGIWSSIKDSANDTVVRFGLNWWLFLSQCISFLIVAFFLWKFAFKRVVTILESRRQTIAEGLENADKIKKRLAEAEAKYQEILTKANDEAQQMINEARASSGALADKKTQQAIGEAEQILVKAREQTAVERDKVFAELKREIGRLVVDTTSKVSGKVLNDEDQRRLAEETARQVAV